nr:hypothetical protein [Tanacetum cinerariifolium]
RETGVSSPTDLPILVFSSPAVPLRATPTRSALRKDCKKNTTASTSGQADKKPGAAGRVSSSPGVPLRAIPTRFALRVDADTKESVVELLGPISSVVKLAICRRIARRTPLRVHLVRLIRSQVHQVAFLPSLRIMLLRPQ